MRLPPKPPPDPTETSLVIAIRKALAELPYVALFRNNTGVLKDVRHRPVRYGLGIGSPDLVGWVTMEDVFIPLSNAEAIAGVRPLIRPLSRFFALEVKREGQKPSPEQREWLQRINRAGGYAQVVYSVEQAKSAAVEAAAGHQL